MNENKCSEDAIKQKYSLTLRFFSSPGVWITSMATSSPALRLVCQAAKVFVFGEIDKQNDFPLSVQMSMLLVVDHKD